MDSNVVLDYEYLVLTELGFNQIPCEKLICYN